MDCMLYLQHQQLAAQQKVRYHSLDGNWFLNAAPGPAIEQYSSLIYDLALRRELINTAEFLQHSSFDLGQEDITANDIIEETENKLFQILLFLLNFYD